MTAATPLVKSGGIASSLAVAQDTGTLFVGSAFEDNKGALYKISPTFSSAQKLSIPGLLAGNQFGKRVAVSADGDVVVVLSHTKLYVLEHQTSINYAVDYSWTSADLLESLAISGDGKTICVGIPSAEGGAGKVEVFKFDGSSWSNTNTLYTPFSQAGTGAFGTDVGIDFYGTTITVGEPTGSGGTQNSTIFENVEDISQDIEDETDYLLPDPLDPAQVCIPKPNYGYWRWDFNEPKVGEYFPITVNPYPDDGNNYDLHGYHAVVSTDAKEGSGSVYNYEPGGYTSYGLDVGGAIKALLTYTCQGWFKWTGGGADATQALFSHGLSQNGHSGGRACYITKADGSMTLVMNTNNGGANVQETLNLPAGTMKANKWYFMSFVFTLNSADIYINGTHAGGITTTYPSYHQNFNWFFGVWRTTYSVAYQWDGYIDSLEIIEAALTEEEVGAYYCNETTGDYYYWDFEAGRTAQNTFIDKNVGKELQSPNTEAYQNAGYQSHGVGGVYSTLDYAYPRVLGLNDNSITDSAEITLSGWFRWNGTSWASGFFSSGLANNNVNGTKWWGRYAWTEQDGRVGIAMGGGYSNTSNWTASDGTSGTSSPQAVSRSTGSDIMIKNVWHHIVAVFKELRAELYLDGVLVAWVDTDTPIDNYHDWTHFNSYVQSAGVGNVGSPWSGLSDEFKIMKYALSAEQITQMYENDLTTATFDPLIQSVLKIFKPQVYSPGRDANATGNLINYGSYPNGVYINIRSYNGSPFPQTTDILGDGKPVYYLTGSDVNQWDGGFNMPAYSTDTNHWVDGQPATHIIMFRPERLTGRAQVLMCDYNSNWDHPAYLYRVDMKDGNLRVYEENAAGNGSDEVLSTPFIWNLNETHQLAVVLNPPNVSIYINAVLVCSYDPVWPNQKSPLRPYVGYYWQWDSFQGGIGHFLSHHDVAYTPTQLAELLDLMNTNGGTGGGGENTTPVVDDYSTTDSPGEPSSNTPYTISFTVDNATTGISIPWSLEAISDDPEGNPYSNPLTFQLYLKVENGVLYRNNTAILSGIADGDHIAITWGGSSGAIYKNGVNVGSGFNVISVGGEYLITSSNKVINGWAWSGETAPTATVSNWRYYSRYLYWEEVLALYNSL